MASSHPSITFGNWRTVLTGIPDYAFAVAAALLWASSAQVIRSSLARMPTSGKAPNILAGLAISLLTGTVVLGIVTCFTSSDKSLVELLEWELALAGVLTFPIGTGLYYLCGYAYAGRAEFASQFANVKPLFSIGIAILFLGESLGTQELYAAAFLFTGVLSLLLGTVRGAFSWLALALGVALAVTWAAGEAFAKLALSDRSSLAATTMALMIGTVCYLVFALPYVLAKRKHVRFNNHWYWGFVAHGFVSFASAYWCLFESIKRIGLAESVIINAFWPALAVVLSAVVSKFRGRPVALPRSMILATALLLVGSLVRVASD